MPRSLVFATCVLIFCSASPSLCAPTPIPGSNPSDQHHQAALNDADQPVEATLRAESGLRHAMDERRRANVSGDTEAISRLMADEYLQTDISGYVQDKTAWLNEYFRPLSELIKANKFHWEVFDQRIDHLRILGNCAVATGSLALKSTGARFDAARHTWSADPSAGFNGVLRFTHVYVKRNGQWLLLALHNQLPPSVAPKPER